MLTSTGDPTMAKGTTYRSRPWQKWLLGVGTCLVLCSPRPMGIKTPASGIPVPGPRIAFFAAYDMRLDRGVPVPHYVRDSILERTRTDIEGTCHNQ